ncbi:hypothetical protein LTR78_000385 [Recurvomyces mirabilis]|uniref:F-box domain-containing protein n=1 Tax=Recurvomyces mirabilis TaxID=574656 RepID=A0AAE0WXV4_9PEZI|nr:hypothetical protein LTR78_000385 [Recurvomyces mirabilis]KAK5162040.1 hypothetical protein LTS14_000386 [Recurvomyces mirabilis]
MNILDLPVDILLLIFPRLDATSFLHLTSTCKSLHQSEFVHDAQFWSNIVRDTFRVPNQPQVQHDGKRWQKLYKRLLTQSRIYTWGSNDKACLGHSFEAPQTAHPHVPGLIVRRAPGHRRRHVSWPAEMEGTENLGVVADVQCGGWSTSMLTAKGAVYTVGVMDGEQFNQRRPPYMQAIKMQPTPLRYPPGFTQAAERHDNKTAIKQFSTGRSHVLGLSDSGRIWSWQDIDHAALHVKFLHHETKEEVSAGRGTVHKVVGGWNKSVALVEGCGIVLWDPLRRGHDDTAIEDTALVMETAVVPNTTYRQTRGKEDTAAPGTIDSTAEIIGEVQSIVALEEIVLFNTHLGKLFISSIIWTRDEQRLSEPFELDVTQGVENADVFVTDVQGSFRSFAVFLKDGTVLTSNQDRALDALHSTGSQDPLFKSVAALQHKDVISVAFGDYHFHALHAPGYITSYGNEPQACGALGLGGHGDPEGRLRGMRYQGIGGDGRLLPHAYSEGRRVWFEEEKRDWITFLTAGGVNPAEAAPRLRMALGSPGMDCQGEISEWIEQQGRDWEDKFDVRSEEDDGLGAYFALSVTAAGWHSGALVLVNEDLAAKVQAACEVRDPALVEEEEEEAQPGADELQADYEEESTSAASPSLLASATAIAYDWGRWFLGLPPYNSAAGSQQHLRDTLAARNKARRAAERIEQIHSPRNYGESPRKGYKYVWANDHFPRLRLTNGVEMPGEVEFDEWRFARPEFDVHAGV